MIRVQPWLPPTSKTRVKQTAITSMAPEARTAPKPRIPMVDLFEPNQSTQPLSAPNLRFSGAIDRDHSVELRITTPITSHTVAQTLQELLMRDIAKEASSNDLTTLKLKLGAVTSLGFGITDQSALADIMNFLGRPVDVIAKGQIVPDTLKTFLSATGRRFIEPGTELHLGPVETFMGSGKNRDVQITYELNHEHIHSLGNLLMQRSGLQNPEKVYQDLDRKTSLNPLEALSYGPRGLADGVLVGHDQVITREDLNAFYQKKGWVNDRHEVVNAAEIQKFNQEHGDDEADYEQHEIPTRPLSSFLNPKSIDGRGKELYENLNELISRIADPTQRIKGPLGRATVQYQFISTDGKLYTKDHAQLPLQMEVLAFPRNQQVNIENVPKTNRGLLHDDVIFFNDDFNDITAKQVAQRLDQLDSKKSQQLNPSHIKILVNSPGGSVVSAQELRRKIKSLQNPVDVIVHGMAASSGAHLLASATGNRFATPDARIMIHEAGIGKGFKEQGLHSITDFTKRINKMTSRYAQIIASAVGRPHDEVLKDIQQDYWMNPLEALLYGKKGLIDGILVSHNKVITRQDARQYLEDKLGGARALDEYLEKRFQGMRQGAHSERYNVQDPFDNALQTIQKMAQTSGKHLAKEQVFKKSVPRRENNITYYSIIPPFSRLMGMMKGLQQDNPFGLTQQEILDANLEGQVKPAG